MSDNSGMAETTNREMTTELRKVLKRLHYPLQVMLVCARCPPCQTSCRPIMIAEHPHRIDIYEQKFVFN
jgi:hypothetical protein